MADGSTLAARKDDYTLDTPMLSEPQLAAFRRDGFVLVQGAFSDEDTAKIIRWTDELQAMPEESGKHWVFHEKSNLDASRDLINRIEKIAPFHGGYLCLANTLKKSVSQLLGEDAALFKDKVNFKMPGGDGFDYHQDSQAGWETYADYFISVMVTIDPATIENGCLEVAPGQHNKGLAREWEPLTEEDMRDMEFVFCETQPGDLVFFDSYTPHGSAPNNSDKIRRAYFATYNRLSAGDHWEQYYADKHKNFPPDIDRDPDKEYVYKV